MTAWAVLAGALAAAVLAWCAIAAVTLVGDGSLRTRPLRWFGSAALAALALGVAGLPVPWYVSPGLLAIGFVTGLTPVPDALTH